MTRAGKNLAASEVGEGTLTIMWLGQSGYALKASDGTVIFIDPYLTDTISNGYRPYIHARMIPPVVDFDDCKSLSAILYTHGHMDHMDPNTVVQLLWNTNAYAVASPVICQSVLRETLRVPEGRYRKLDEFESMEIGAFKVTAVPANHGPGAIGYVVEAEGQCLYFCGDTQLFYTMPELAKRWDISTAFLCFNGQGGNMDISGAVAAAEMLKVHRVIPIHYGMYVDNNADPILLGAALSNKLPDVEFMVVNPGECVSLN